MRAMQKKSNMKEAARKLAPMLLTAVFVVMLAVFAPGALAAVPGDHRTEVINGIVDILKYVCSILGALFALIGIVKFAISHANEDGPAQQKAIMMMATGLLLVVLGALVLGNLNVASWIA